MKQRKNNSDTKRNRWQVKGLLAVLAVSTVLTGCQAAKTVPKMEKVAQMDDDTISEKMAGFTKSDLVEAWGEPQYELFHNGSLFNLNEEGTYLCVFYEAETDKITTAYLDNSGGVQNFTGTVEEDYETSAVVKIDDNGYWILSSGNLVTVGLNNRDELLDVEVGDKVYVEYFGGVMESMPLQLQNQLHISTIDRAGSFEDVDDALLDVGTLDGVVVELLDVTPTSAKLGILNTTDLEVDYGEDYNIQVFEDGEWHDVPYLVDNWAIPAIGYTTPKNIRVEWDVDWSVLHGELESGKYRIAKSLMDFRGTGDYTTYHYFLEFELPAE